MDRTDEAWSPDLIAFKWAETLSTGEQSVLLTSSLKRLQSMIDSRPSVAAPPPDPFNNDRCMFCGGKTEHEPDCDHGVRPSVAATVDAETPPPIPNPSGATRCLTNDLGRCPIHGECNDSEYDAEAFDEFLRTDPSAQVAMRQQWAARMEAAMNTKTDGLLNALKKVGCSSEYPDCAEVGVMNGSQWVCANHAVSTRLWTEMFNAAPSDSSIQATARHYFCSCGGTLTAEEYIEHYFEKGHDQGDPAVRFQAAAAEIEIEFPQLPNYSAEKIAAILSKRLGAAAVGEHAELQRRLFDECVTANWDPERKNTFAEEIAHLHEELSEAFRAWRKYKDCEVREVNGKLEGVPIEFADVVIGLFYNAELHGFNLLEAVERKHEFNLKRNYIAEGRQLHAAATPTSTQT